MRWDVGPEASRYPPVSLRSVVVWSSQQDFVLLSLQDAVRVRGGFVFHLCSLSFVSESELPVKFHTSLIESSFFDFKVIFHPFVQLHSSFQTPAETTGTNKPSLTRNQHLYIYQLQNITLYGAICDIIKWPFFPRTVRTLVPGVLTDRLTTLDFVKEDFLFLLILWEL